MANMIFKKRERKENKKNIGGDYPFRTNQHMPPLEEKNVEGVQWQDKKKFLFARVSYTCSSKANDVLTCAMFIKNKILFIFLIKLSHFPYDQIITATKTIWNYANTYEAML